MPHDPYYPSGDNAAPSNGEQRKMGDRRCDAMAIVGESDYQKALRSILDAHGRSVVTFLVPEPETLHDPNAVAVVIDERTVGYLNTHVAKSYGPVLKARSTPMSCPAVLHGGEWDIPTIHVVLNFSDLRHFVCITK